MSHDFIHKQVPETALLRLVKLAAQHARRLEKLVRECLSSRAYNPETAHQIRILTRKCTAAWRVLRHAGAEVDHDKSHRTLRALRKTLGDLRDADILLEEFHDFTRHKKVASDEIVIGCSSDDLVAVLHQSSRSSS